MSANEFSNASSEMFRNNLDFMLSPQVLKFLQRPACNGLRVFIVLPAVLPASQQRIQANQGQSFDRLPPVQLPGLKPFLESNPIQVRHDTQVLERDGFAFGLAS